MGGTVVPGPLFAGASTRRDLRARRLAFLAASALLQAGLLVLVTIGFQSAAARRPAPVEPVVEVRLMRPQFRAPSPPPALGRPAPRPHVPATEPRTARMVQPRALPVVLPVEAGVPEPTPQAPDGEVDSSAAGPGGRPGGVIGGAPEATEGLTLQQAPPQVPIAARTHDLAAVRAGIARTLVYPPNARRNGLQGKVILEFVLLAEGRIRDLVLRSSSGFSALDTAALAAVEAAAPFPPPGLDVLVVVPVVFRAE